MSIFYFISIGLLLLTSAGCSFNLTGGDWTKSISNTTKTATEGNNAGGSGDLGVEGPNDAVRTLRVSSVSATAAAKDLRIEWVARDDISTTTIDYCQAMDTTPCHTFSNQVTVNGGTRHLMIEALSLNRYYTIRARGVLPSGSMSNEVITGPVKISPDIQPYFPDDKVNALLRDGNTLYVGGNFSTWRPQLGGIAAFNNSGDLQSIPMKSRVELLRNLSNHEINAITEDGLGGYFATGLFDRVGGSDKHVSLVHITKDHVVDENFKWSIYKNTGITNYSTYGNGKAIHFNVSNQTLYVGGDFNYVSNCAISTCDAINNYNLTAGAGITESRGRMAILNVASFNSDGTVGTVTINAHDAASNAEVRAFLQNGAYLYVGGDFTTIGGATRAHFAQFHMANLTWALTPNAVSDFDAPVYALDYALASDRIYIGGLFSNYVKYTSGTTPGAAYTSAGLALNSDVKALKIDPSDSNRLFVGGQFTAPANYFAAFDSISTTPTLNSNYPYTNDYVYSIAATANRVWVGGKFWQATLNATTTSHYGLFSFNPALQNYDLTSQLKTCSHGDDPGTVPYCLAGAVVSPITALLATNSGMRIGGKFYSMTEVARSKFAAIDLLTGRPKAFSLALNDEVLAIEKVKNNLWLGGKFTNAQGLSGQNKLLMIDVSNESNASDIKYYPTNIATGSVQAIKTTYSHVYVGGDFSGMNAVSGVNYLARFAANTAAIDSTFKADMDAPTTSLERAGSSLFVGGLFSQFFGLNSIQGLAALNLNNLTPTTNGIALSWKAGHGTLATKLRYDAIYGALRIFGPINTIAFDGGAAVNDSYATFYPGSGLKERDSFGDPTNEHVKAVCEYSSNNNAYRMSGGAGFALTDQTTTTYAMPKLVGISIDALECSSDTFFVGGSFAGLEVLFPAAGIGNNQPYLQLRTKLSNSAVF